MALTNAERQAEYRRRQQTAGDNGRRKVEVYVTTRCALTLKRLARHRGTTQGAVLEELLAAADDAADRLGRLPRR